MKEKWQRFCYLASQKFLVWSGKSGASEYMEMRQTRYLALVRFNEAEGRRLTAERKLQDLLYAARLTDGLISAGQPDRGQEQLRVAIIAAGKP